MAPGRFRVVPRFRRFPSAPRILRLLNMQRVRLGIVFEVFKSGQRIRHLRSELPFERVQLFQRAQRVQPFYEP